MATPVVVLDYGNGAEYIFKGKDDMNNIDDLKAFINAKIKTNGRQSINGAVLNEVLNAMVDFFASPIFIATYGTTTFEEIQSAKEEGRLIVCDNEGVLLYLTYMTSTNARFASIIASPDTEGYFAKCSSSNVWTFGTFRVEDCFPAIYGETTYAEVLRQINDLGKVAFCNYDGHTYYLTDSGDPQDPTFSFTSQNGKSLSLSINNSWSHSN